MGTTEEALANAEKLGYHTGLLLNIHLQKKRYLFISLICFDGLWYWSNFGCPAHDQRDFDFAKKYKLIFCKWFLFK